MLAVNFSNTVKPILRGLVPSRKHPERQKMKSLSFVVLTIAIIFCGCSSTPRVRQVVPVHVLPPPTASNTTAGPYTYSQEPAKRVLEDGGKEYNRHVKELQKMRLRHEREMAAIEQKGEEQKLARERGITLPSETATAYTQPAPNAGAGTFSYVPPTYYYSPGYGYGGSGWGYGASGGVYGGLSYQSGFARGGWRGNLFGIRFRQSTPGLRHFYGGGYGTGTGFSYTPPVSTPPGPTTPSQRIPVNTGTFNYVPPR